MLAYAFGSPNVMFGLSGQACYGRAWRRGHRAGDYSVFDAGQWFPDRYDDPASKFPNAMIIWGYNIHATCPTPVRPLDHRSDEARDPDHRQSIRAVLVRILAPSTGCRSGRDGCPPGHGVIERHHQREFYDHKFWRNGQRRPPDSQDSNKLLRENDISTGGSAANFVILGCLQEKHCGVGHGAGRCREKNVHP